MRRSVVARAVAAVKADPSLAERVLLLAEPAPATAVRSAEGILSHVRPLLDGRDAEAFAVLVLDARNRVIETRLLTTGSDRATVVDVRQVLRFALTRSRAAVAIVLAHNHPSGDPTPSAEDRQVTSRVADGCAVVGLKLLDHIIVVEGGFHSFAACGDLPLEVRR